MNSLEQKFLIFAICCHKRSIYTKINILKQYGLAYDVVSEYTCNKYTVFVPQNNNNEIIVAVKGIYSKTYADRVADFGFYYGLDEITPRYRQTLRVVNKLMEEYPNASLRLCGISIGGMIASEISTVLFMDKSLKVPCYAFNVHSWNKYVLKDPAYVIRENTTCDFVKVFDSTGVEDVNNPHSYKNFITDSVENTQEEENDNLE